MIEARGDALYYFKSHLLLPDAPMLICDFGCLLLQTWKVASEQCEAYGWEESFTGVSMRWPTAVTSGHLTLATILATWRKIWRRNMGSQRCWNLLDISISREDTLECTRRFHVTSRPAAGEYIRRALG
ncbi:hypothetical protein AVEN_138258-1 [Araneus ventricosus]|uniref:Uncharacterized protein n=1 Tax=Araneus ventricosus TaxID=182803 RepID=A0A4Y2MJ35_ARAVE|nr:hypothetical protein AVEN_14326-1 [Araneus ventricosus]GBN27171.1 hypothetical protein AVEN_138258-1 [Araneus ventricosus]